MQYNILTEAKTKALLSIDAENPSIKFNIL
jgi:hypothetical protein